MLYSSIEDSPSIYEVEALQIISDNSDNKGVFSEYPNWLYGLIKKGVISFVEKDNKIFVRLYRRKNKYSNWQYITLDVGSYLIYDREKNVAADIISPCRENIFKKFYKIGGITKCTQ